MDQLVREAQGQLWSPMSHFLTYLAPMRDLLIEGARASQWSTDIHREWIEALLRNEPRRDRAVFERIRDLMDRVVRDCLVAG